MILIALLAAAVSAAQQDEAARKRNYDNWETCVNVNETDNFDRAILACDRLLEPTVELSAENRAMVYAKRGTLRRLKKLPNVAIEVGRYAEAIQDLTLVLNVNSGAEEGDFYRAKVGRAIALIFTREYRRAVSDLTDAIDAKKGDLAHAAYLRGLCWRALGDEQSAKNDIAWAIRTDKDIETKLKSYPEMKGLIK